MSFYRLLVPIENKIMYENLIYAKTKFCQPIFYIIRYTTLCIYILYIIKKENGGNWNISVKIGRTCIKYTYFIEGGGQANIYEFLGGKSKIEVI